MLSIFDIYKIGVGQSSSHTNGPMIAAHDFINSIKDLSEVKRVKVELYGSLSLTGKGHHTDRATFLGLMGNHPESINIEFENKKMKDFISKGELLLNSKYRIEFDFEKDIIFLNDYLPQHENAMKIYSFDNNDEDILSKAYFSVGGGFVKSEDDFKETNDVKDKNVSPYPFKSADDLVRLSSTLNISISELVLKNELALLPDHLDKGYIVEKCTRIWNIMQECAKRGFNTEGILEGGLNISRRAPELMKNLSDEDSANNPLYELDWINMFAFAVSEENASGGQIITSPTNGAAGVIPAVLMYYDKFISKLDADNLLNFFSVSAAIGMLYKMNASISGAEVGCQGEIGVSSSMAAAGLAALLGGTNEQICIAAEIAMEHSLGMTCDPISGLVQVPCIERNAMGAMKAINASRMALRRKSKALISLDEVIETMYETGKDLHSKYRETSLGGLALINFNDKPPCE